MKQHYEKAKKKLKESGGRTKVAIVGFAPGWQNAPFKDETFEIWTLNEAYRMLPQVEGAGADRWFELHSRNSPSKNKPEHIAFLQSCPVPLYMWEHYDDMPNSIKFPKDELTKLFNTSYFTNSISWMIAMAVYEGFETIHVYGVDMAQDDEFKYQKPSVEFFLGVAQGLGIDVFVPANSDLLKTALMYGFESDNAMRLKMKSRQKELKDKKAQLEQQMAQSNAVVAQCRDAIHQINGALDDMSYWLKNWQI